MTSAALPGAPPVIEVRGARLGYGEHVVLEEVDLAVGRGDFLAIVGPNGTGKTTLLRAILGITPSLAGFCVSRGRLGYAPQRGALDHVYPFTAREVVAMGLLGRNAPGSASGDAPGRAQAAAAVTKALEACGLTEKADAAFRDLSGGQRQRVLVARALVSEPDVLVLDEPTNDLDLKGEHEVMELVRSLHAGGRTVVLVSHQLHVVARYAEKIAFIRAGRLTHGLAHDMLTPARLGALYEVPVAVGEFDGHPVVSAGGTVADDADVPVHADDVQEAKRLGRELTKEERRDAARARRDAARIARSERLARPAAPASPAPVAPAQTPSREEPGAPRWLAPALILLLITTLVASVARARSERAHHEATLTLLAAERLARTADARAAQEREIDAAELAALLRTDVDAARVDREAMGTERDEARAAVARTEEKLALAEANRAALNAELQRTGQELAKARLEVEDGAAALDDALRSRDLVAQEKAGLQRALADAEAREEHLRGQARALERESAEVKARIATLEREAEGARARLAQVDAELAQARPVRASLLGDAAALTSFTPLVLRVADGRVAGPAVQAALEGAATVAVCLRHDGAPELAARLRARIEVQGEPVAVLARSPAGANGDPLVRFWVDRTAAARCARGFARDGFVLVVALEADPTRPDEVVSVQALELVVTPVSGDAGLRLRTLDPGEQEAR